MAAIVCHGLQSCLESQLVESRIHMLRLPSPKPKPLTSPPHSQPIDIDIAFKSCLWEQNTKPHCDETDTASGWSFIQSLSNNASQSAPKEIITTTYYVHPQAKQSSLRLSPKSLELCTENLGNETGTDITQSAIDFELLTNKYSSSSSDSGGGNLGTREPMKTRQQTKPRSFPPPLTTIRGSESLTVRPHREGGRLVIEMTKAPSTASCFHAERSHGRLRLCLLENRPNQSYDEEEEKEDDDSQGFEGEFESEMNEEEIQDVEKEEEEEEEEKGEVEGVENEDGERGSWGMKMDKYERGGGRRCKEGGGRDNNDLLSTNWVAESLWVATS